MSEFSPELRKELLDDFYAESDELLTAIRESLVGLEQALETGRLEPELVERAFRSTHSLKGIAAIAGVRPAELVAHAMEDVLRVLAQKNEPLTADRLDGLLDAAKCLEQIIVAHRHGTPVPECAELLTTLRGPSHPVRDSATAGGQASAAPAVAAPPSARDPIPALRDRGLEPWRCTFAPSRELEARGITVNHVRARLAELGEIALAAPAIRPDKSVVFVFTVGLREAPADLSRWAEEGMQFERVVDRDPAPVAGPAGAGETATDALSLAPTHFVRVDLERLDDLMRLTGELVIQRSRFENRIQQQFAGNEILKEIDLGFARTLRDLRKAIARVRLVSIGEIFSRVPFVLRDLAAGTPKRVRVVVEGKQTEIDKYLAERLKEPLLHLVRNAFSHAVETPAERTAAGKEPEATLTLRAASLGESVLIQIKDDGRGIDRPAVVSRARRLGLSVPEEVDDRALLEILSASGFSTRDEADRASGRGVGMAVVANTVRELGGTVALETELGRGTTFKLRLPLSLSISDAIIVSIGDEICAVPQGLVDEVVQIAAGEARGIRQTEVVPYREGLLPLVRLRSLFGLGPSARDIMTILVVSSERGATGVVVDSVRGRREVVVRPLADPLVRVAGVTGATELGDGRPILILDPGALTSGVVRPSASVPQNGASLLSS